MDLVVTSQNWMKIDYNWPILSKKWDKNKNNGFGLEQPNLIIKLANFERKSMKNQWKLNEISGKIITNLSSKLMKSGTTKWIMDFGSGVKNWEKIDYNWPISNQKVGQK